MHRKIDMAQFVRFLQSELAISSDEIAVLLHHPELEEAPLPMVLWQYGLISPQQLTQIYDWMETQADLALDVSSMG